MSKQRMQPSGRSKSEPKSRLGPPCPTVDPNVHGRPTYALQDSPGGGNQAALGAMEMEVGLGADRSGRAAYGANGRDRVGPMIAQAMLADSFDIVGDDFIGPRMPNQVTKEEYQRIAILYSEIEAGHTHIQFGVDMQDADDQIFRDEWMQDIENMLTTVVGRELLDDLAYGNSDGQDHKTYLHQASVFDPLTITPRSPEQTCQD
jgi:hypothetical protein